MKSIHRIQSVINAKNLDTTVTGVPTFDLSLMELTKIPDCPLPENLRLGHLVERVVSVLFGCSLNYEVLYENLQIQENHKTIGEIDFIIKDLHTGRISHVELAYKFYLFDPSMSSNMETNWIGPNRNDMLHEKLSKLRRKQFPLLTKDCTRTRICELPVDQIDQSLCLLGYLFTPYDQEFNLSPHYKKNIVGHYLSVETFKYLDHSDCSYYFPAKTEWGVDPSVNEEWSSYDDTEALVASISKEKQSLLCWKRQNEGYAQFFITWW